MIAVRDADWATDGPRLLAIRFEVFVVGQGVTVEEEVDGIDPGCVHVLATVDGEAAGTGRMQPDGHIGRMAVLERFRGRGVGGAVLLALVERAVSRGLRRTWLGAQTHAIPFYRRHGFREYGEMFLDSRIEHRLMERLLTS